MCWFPAAPKQSSRRLFVPSSPKEARRSHSRPTSPLNPTSLRCSIAQKPAGMTVTVADISQIPPYDEDVRAQGFPPSVETLRRQIAGADALLFACPEYNYSMSGVLKNAIDWASRPPDQPFAGKPCAIIGAAAGMAGSARAQYDLRAAASFSTCTP